MELSSLIIDIQKLLKTRDWVTEALANPLSTEIVEKLKQQFNDERKKPSLRLSQMGPRCPCALWHSIHHPELAEPLPPWAEFKYMYGHVIEALAITLAKAAGHEVTGEQDAVTVDGILGHRDCIIDGCLVDVKSTSSFGYQKFKDGTLAEGDTFGYLDQLDGYLTGSVDDPLLRVKDKGYLLAIDKTLGHMCLYEHRIRLAPDGTPAIKQRIQQFKNIVGRDTAPECTCETVSDGKSGNYKLGTRASYSSYKHCCFPHLRTFLYAGGPVYLTKVVRKPDVIEIDRYGKVVYN